MTQYEQNHDKDGTQVLGVENGMLSLLNCIFFIHSCTWQVLTESLLYASLWVLAGEREGPPNEGNMASWLLKSQDIFLKENEC